MTPQAALDRGLAGLALALPPEARDRLLAFVELLAKWNRTYNLTAIRDPMKTVSHHLLDSLAVLPHLPMPADGTYPETTEGVWSIGTRYTLCEVVDWARRSRALG